MSSGALEGGVEGSPQPSVDGRRRLVAESLRVGNPANNARELPAQADPLRECQIELAVEDIRPYEHNPRHAGNARFADIKQSIRASGVRNPLTVTRRPGEAHFIVEAGGNSRLLAVQQLWQETGEARFHKLWVLFRPWRSESHVLISHLIENEQRGDMTFWDKANGIAALKTQLEAEQGRSISVRQLVSDLKDCGIPVSHTTLNHYRFATTRLRLLGESITELSGVDVARMQPRLNLIKGYAQSRASLDEDTLYEQVLTSVFRRHADLYRHSGVFQPDTLCQDCEAALALHLNEPVTQCRKAMQALARPAAASDANPQDVAVHDEEGSDEADMDIEPAGADAAAGKGLSTASAVPVPQTVRSHEGESTGHASLADLGFVAASRSVVQGNGDSLSDAIDTLDYELGDDHQRLTAEVERFARVAGVANCLRAEEGAPLGYLVDDLPAADRGTLPTLKQRAWWLLGLLCGQSDHGLPTAAAHDSAASAPMASTRASQGNGGVPAIDLPFLLWLFDASDEAAASFRQVMALFITWRRSSALHGCAPLAPAAIRAERD